MTQREIDAQTARRVAQDQADLLAGFTARMERQWAGHSNRIERVASATLSRRIKLSEFQKKALELSDGGDDELRVYRLSTPDAFGYVPSRKKVS